MDERPDLVRVVIALVVVVAAMIALIVGFGVVAARVAPDIGGDDVVEAAKDTPTFSDANALMVAIGCPDPVVFEPFDGLGPDVRSYALPTVSRCVSDGTLGFVYVDADDRLTAEDDKDISDRICATVVTEEEIVTTTLPPDPAAPTVAPTETTVTPADTTAATSTTVPDEVVFGLVRGPNWVLATAAGEDAAMALAGKLTGSVVFTQRCEATSG